MKKLYRYEMDCGRCGTLSGLFVAEEERVKALIGKEVYFGEVLGKHSEVFGEIEEGDIKEISDDQEKIEWLVKTFGSDNLIGYNPLECSLMEDDDEEEEYD